MCEQGSNQGSNGMLVGIVTSLADPDRIGRVKVRYPTLGNEESYWARVVSPMAGRDRGTFFRPEIDDEVLVGFAENGERDPLVLGALWSKQDMPPADDGDQTANNWRFVKSRSGHVIKLDDTKGKERIELEDKDRKRRVVIDSAKDHVRVECDSGHVSITARAGTVTISAKDITLDASGTMTIRGKAVSIN